MTKALADLEGLGIAQNDTAVAVFVHAGVSDSQTSEAAARLETDLIALMREEAPDAEDYVAPFNLQLACQKLRKVSIAMFART